MIRSILVVCVGNICRSPMAAALLQARLPEMEVRSAGLGALVGFPPDQHAIELMLTQGYDITGRRAAQLRLQDCLDSDLILVMDNEQKRVIESQHPVIRGRVFRLGEFGGFDISDPYKLTRIDFELCFELVSRGVGHWADRLKVQG